MPSSASNPSAAAGMGFDKKVAEEDEELKVGDSEASGGVKATLIGDMPDAIVFICETYTDFLCWRKALESYVV